MIYLALRQCIVHVPVRHEWSRIHITQLVHVIFRMLVHTLLEVPGAFVTPGGSTFVSTCSYLPYTSTYHATCAMHHAKMQKMLLMT